MSDVNAVNPVETTFPSFASLRLAHNKLLKRHRESGAAPESAAEIMAFMRGGQAAGALLDDENDRQAAQSLLDYWAVQLYRLGQEPPEAGLAEFDPELAPELSDELCPYVGLDAFGEGDSAHFFGRQRLIAVLVERLQSERLLAVIGPSGSGKSSLVRAGLLPALRGGALPGGGALKSSADWTYLPPLVPGSRPLEGLARLAGGEAEEYRASPTALAGRLAQLPGGQGLLVVDQFEEVFTLCSDPADRAAFVNNLLEAARDQGTAFRVVLTMRADFESMVQTLPDFQPHFERSVVRMTPLNANELREAIVAPADLIGLKFDPGLVDALLNDILGEPAALPLLQFTLLKLWERRARNRVTWEAYRELGGAAQALAHCADEFYEKLIPQERVTVRRIFLRLVRPGEGLEVTSRRIRRGDLYTRSEAATWIDAALDKLLAVRLLRLTRGETPEDDQVEVAHEALVRNWPTLIAWLDEDRRQLRERQRLTSAAERWQAREQDPSLLLRGADLTEALRLEDLSKLEAAFVQASTAALEREEAEKEAIRARELEDARRIAEQTELRRQAETARAQEAEAAAIRLRRRAQWITALAVLALVAALATAFFAGLAKINEQRAEAASTTAVAQQKTAQAASTKAIAQQILAVTERARAVDEAHAASTAQVMADEQRLIAEAQRSTVEAASTAAVAQQHIAETERARAVAEANIAATQRAIAEAQSLIVEEQGRAALARQVASQSLNYLESGKLDLALLLAVEACRLELTAEGRSALLSGLEYGLDLKTTAFATLFAPDEAYVYALAFSPDGRRIAAGLSGGGIAIWDVATQKLTRWPAGHTSVVFSLSFSPDGKLLASASKDGSAILWNGETGEKLAQFGQTRFWYISAAFNPTDGGRILALGRDDNRLLFYDTRERKVVREEALWGDPWSMAWAADGRRLAVAAEGFKDTDNSFLQIWDLEDNVWLYREGFPTNQVRSVAWSPASRNLVAIGGSDGLIRLWDVEGHAIVGKPVQGHERQVFSLAFSRDGKYLASGGADSSVRLWDVSNPTSVKLFEKISPHRNYVMGVAFSPQGLNLLASGSLDKTIGLRELNVQQPLSLALPGKWGDVSEIALPVEGQGLAAEANGEVVVVRKLQGGQVLARATADPQTPLALSGDGKVLVLVGADGRLQRMDLPAGRMEALALDMTAEELNPAELTALALDGTGSRLATGGCAELLQAGDQAVCGRARIDVWELSSGKRVASLSGHGGPVTALAFDPGGEWLASGSQDQTILIWEVAAGQPARPPLVGHSAAITSLAFRAEEELLASGDANGALLLWQTDSGQMIRNYSANGSGISGLTNLGQAVSGLAFSADGAALVAASSAGQLQRWEVGLEAWIAQACEVAGRSLSPAEWGQIFPGQGYRETCP